MKKLFWLGFADFLSDVISGGRTFRSPGPKLLDGSISLKLLKTRLKSKSFDTLDDLLGLQVQTL